jgi:protein-disulfide isomerase
MGGQRTNHRQKQRQSAARAVAAARGSSRDRTRILIGIVVVVVIAGAVLAGVLIQQHRSTAAAQTVIPVRTVAGSSAYPASVDKTGATVLVGQPTAKVTIDAYEDFLCPICGQFEAANFTGIEQQLEAGKIQVRYHMINLLDSRSNPPGYSLMAANTALAVATVAPGKFIDFHYSLYQKQPEENGTGWTQAQLSNLANRLGVSGSTFDNVVNNKTYEQQIQTNLTTAENDQSLWQTNSDGSKSFGTPTVVVDGAPVDWQNTAWLTNLVTAAYSQK